MINFVSFMLTNQCNSFCKYCYVDAHNEAEKLLTVEQIKSFLKLFWDNNGKVILFTGGEVFLYPELEQVLEYAKSLGLVVRLFSNGLLLDKDQFERIKGFIDGFAISLDGTQEIHDYRRGVKGAYEKTLQVLQYFKEHRFPYTIQMTVGKSNLEYIDHVAQIARQYDAEVVKLANVIKVGRGAHCKEEHLNDEDLLMIKHKAVQISEEYNYRPIFCTNLTTEEEMNLYYKNDGLQPIFWIDSKGDLCLFTTSNKDFFRIGHISHFPFENVEKVVEEKREQVNSALFQQIKGRKICDLYEELEMLAHSFSSPIKDNYQNIK